MFIHALRADDYAVGSRDAALRSRTDRRVRMHFRNALRGGGGEGSRAGIASVVNAVAFSGRGRLPATSLNLRAGAEPPAKLRSCAAAPLSFPAAREKTPNYLKPLITFPNYTPTLINPLINGIIQTATEIIQLRAATGPERKCRAGGSRDRKGTTGKINSVGNT